MEYKLSPSETQFSSQLWITQLPCGGRQTTNHLCCGALRAAEGGGEPNCGRKGHGVFIILAGKIRPEMWNSLHSLLLCNFLVKQVISLFFLSTFPFQHPWNTNCLIHNCSLMRRSQARFDTFSLSDCQQQLQRTPSSPGEKVPITCFLPSPKVKYCQINRRKVVKYNKL